MRIDQLAAMRLFVRIVELGSFGKAARAMGMSSSNVTERIAKLEEALGIRLLARSTRAVAPTVAGSRYFEVCRRLLSELGEIEASLSDSQEALAGRVRVSANMSVARSIIVPQLPQWAEQHPKIHVELIMSDQRSNFVREGIDFAVRIGGLEDQDLVLRSLGRPLRVTVASPEYLSRMGRPEKPDDLVRHRLIDFLLPQTGEKLEWEFEEAGRPVHMYPPTIAAVGDSDARLQLAIAGMGIVQSLSFIAAPALREGKLERILAKWETPAPKVAILYPRNRHLPARTQATMDAFTVWIRTAIENAV